MTQAELNRQVARATGETVREIQNRGFTVLMAGPYERDPEPAGELDREPLTVDWDELDRRRAMLFPLCG